MDDPANSGAGTPTPPPEIDVSVAHPARVYDYLLGGKDNFPADREAAEHVLAVAPGRRDSARANRAWLARAVRFLAQQGIRQFLDIGTGIPTSPNVHEVAQGIAPESRVVYVDNDPIVHVHARALLTTSPEGATDYLDADLRDPERILKGAAQTLDFSRPVGLILCAILHLIATSDDPHGIVRRLLAALAPGSFLALSHLCRDVDEAGAAAMSAAYARDGITLVPRSRAEILRFFDGLELVEPGLVQVPLWRPDPGSELPADLHHVWSFGGVARK